MSDVNILVFMENRWMQWHQKSSLRVQKHASPHPTNSVLLIGVKKKKRGGMSHT